MRIKDKIRTFTSPNYNYRFDMRTGYFERDTIYDYSPYGAEIADIEVSTICNCDCPSCYKSNTVFGDNMSYSTFVNVFDNLPSTVCQVALGIGNVSANPDLFKIMNYIRLNNVIPNITISSNDELDDAEVSKLADVCGAISVSCYDTDKCFALIKRLQAAGAKQVNIHHILANETCDDIRRVMRGIVEARLNINALVLLWYKDCGRDRRLIGYTNPYKHQVEEIIFLSKVTRIALGFDSCSAANIVELYPPYVKKYIEPCESTLFSIYIDVYGMAHPCSFATHSGGIDMTVPISFIRDVWESKIFGSFRRALLHNRRACPIYDLKFKHE